MDFSETRAKWLEEYGFSAEGKTYVISGDSYSIKDELKARGFKFDYTLKWHRSYPDDEYADRTVEIDLNDIAEINAYGKGHYKDGAAKFVNEKIAGPQAETEFGEDIESKLLNKEVTFLSKFGFSNRFGWTNVYKFQCGKVIYMWMTSITLTESLHTGDKVFLSGIVKSHTIYKGEHQTNLKRCKIKKNG